MWGEGQAWTCTAARSSSTMASSVASLHKDGLRAHQCGDVDAALGPDHTWAPAPMCHPSAEAPGQGHMTDLEGCIYTCVQVGL